MSASRWADRAAGREDRRGHRRGSARRRARPPPGSPGRRRAAIAIRWRQRIQDRTKDGVVDRREELAYVDADRVVQHLLIGATLPGLERWFAPQSYACRAGKGTHRCLRRAIELWRVKHFVLAKGQREDAPRLRIVDEERPASARPIRARLEIACKGIDVAGGVEKERGDFGRAPLASGGGPARRPETRAKHRAQRHNASALKANSTLRGATGRERRRSKVERGAGSWV